MKRGSAKGNRFCKASEPWARVLMIAALFLPTPIIAARPRFAGFLVDDWIGVPQLS